MQLELWVDAEGCEQAGDQITVQFDDVQAGAAGDQGFGEGALAGADFYQVVLLGGGDGRDDLVDNAGVAKEVLAEAFAGMVAGSWRGHDRHSIAVEIQ